MNQPMKASQTPPTNPPAMNSANPDAIRTKAITCPVWAALRLARTRSPRRLHRRARNILPPSSGAAGSRLNSPTSRLVTPSQYATPTTIGAAPAVCNAATSPPNAAASAKLRTGPAIAIRSAALGVFASPPRVDMPPTNHSVMSTTETPQRRATTTCASSWATSDANSISAPQNPASQYAAVEQPSTVLGNEVARLQVNNKRMTTTLQWTRTGHPAMRPTGMVSRTARLP